MSFFHYVIRYRNVNNYLNIQVSCCTCSLFKFYYIFTCIDDIPPYLGFTYHDNHLKRKYTTPICCFSATNIFPDLFLWIVQMYLMLNPNLIKVNVILCTLTSKYIYFMKSRYYN